MQRSGQQTLNLIYRTRAMMNKNEPISDEETLITIERSLGFRINPKEFTVKEYYTYLSYLIKQNGTKKNK